MEIKVHVSVLLEKTLSKIGISMLKLLNVTLSNFNFYQFIVIQSMWVEILQAILTLPYG